MSLADQDWTAPPPSDPSKKPAPLFEWKVDIDRYDGPCIFEVPPIVKGLDTKIRLIAKCESKRVADLIVSLYEAHRRSR